MTVRSAGPLFPISVSVPELVKLPASVDAPGKTVRVPVLVRSVLTVERCTVQAPVADTVPGPFSVASVRVTLNVSLAKTGVIVTVALFVNASVPLPSSVPA